MDRLFKNYYSAYCTLKEYLEDPERLKEWREAEKPSQEWRKGFYFQSALKVLEAALS